jgi:amino acid transporter
MCGLARVNTGDYWGNTACGPTVGDFRVEWRIFLIAVVLVAALAVLAITLIRLERRATEEGRATEGHEDRSWILQLLIPVVLAGALLLWLGQNGPRDLMFDVPLPSELVALALLGLFVLMALVAVTARDPRRFALGICASGGLAFLVLYPNLSALPMPNNIVSVYNGLLPTWLYGFQFSVNLQPAASVSLLDSSPWLLALAVLCVAVVAGYAAWGRRVINGYRRHRLLTDGGRADGDEGDGPGAAAGETEASGSETGTDGTRA